MKMVVAYIERASFEPIREELLAQGFLSISAWEASGSVPEPTVTGHYRGTSIENHLRPKTRIECVVGDDHVAAIVDTVLKLGGERSSRSSRPRRSRTTSRSRPRPADP